MRGLSPGILVIAALIGSAESVRADPASEVRIAPEDCRRLVRHLPDSDVAYTPGVDVRGNAVAPADQPGQPRIAAPDVVVIQLTVDLLRRYGVPAESPLAPRGEAAVGVLTYDIASGRMTYDGQPLSDPEQDALAAACAAQQGK